MSEVRRRNLRTVSLLTALALAWWAFSPSTAAAQPQSCSLPEMEALAARVDAARVAWRTAASAVSHQALTDARTALIAYALRCDSQLGRDASRVLARSVSVPRLEHPDGEPATRAPGDYPDLFITTVPTSISGSAGTTLTYALLITVYEKNSTTPCMEDFVFADELGAGATISGSEDPSWANDGCAGAGLPGAVGGFYCCLGENLPYTFPSTYWTIRVQASANDEVSLTSEASTHGADFESSTLNNTSTASIRFSASSGLSIAASGPAGVVAGSPITWTSTVNNAGPSTAEGVVVKDFVPNEVDITGFSSSSGSCSSTPGSHTVTCNLGVVAAGGSRTVTVSGVVKPSVPDATVIFNDVQVSSATQDPDDGDDIDVVATTVDAGTSGLSLSQSGPVSADAGTNVSYMATIENVGGTPANEVVLRVFAPPELEVAAFTTPVGDCNVEAAGGPSCNLGTIPAGASRSVQVMERIRTSTADGTVLFHTSQVSSDAFESSTADNLDTDSTLINGATSGLTVAAVAPPTAAAGAPIAYTLTVTNVGPDTATDVELKDAIPNEIVLTSMTASQGACNVGALTPTCTLGNLAPAGGAATVLVGGLVKASVADGTTILNSATVQSSAYESDAGDNTALASTTVDAQADLSIDTVDSTDPVNIDTPFRWVNTITNAGPSDATGVVLIDTIPHLVEELKVRVLPSGCDRFEETIKCSLGTIKAGQTVTMNVELEAMVNAGPAISHTVEVSSLADDPDLTFNTDTETTTLQAPDMIGSFTTLSSACDAALAVCQIKGKFKVTNAGNAKSVQSALRFVYSANTTLGSGDPQLKKFTVNQLKPGESQEFKYNLVFPINQFVIAQVDSASQIPETNEANNLALKGPFPKP